jgi:hypothetical protein
MDKDSRNRFLFDRFIYKQLVEGSERFDRPYSTKQRLHWLSSLARLMSLQNESIFFIERLQPSLLLSKTQQIIYRFLTWLPIFLIAVAIAGVTWQIFQPSSFAVYSGGVAAIVFIPVVLILRNGNREEIEKKFPFLVMPLFNGGWRISELITFTAAILGGLVGLVLAMASRESSVLISDDLANQTANIYGTGVLSLWIAIIFILTFLSLLGPI